MLASTRCEVDDLTSRKAFAKYFRETLHHPLGYALMLTETGLCQVARTEKAVVIELANAVAEFLATRGEGVCAVGFEDKVAHHHVVETRVMITRAVPSVVADIERFVTFGRGSLRPEVRRIRQLVAGGLFGVGEHVLLGSLRHCRRAV